MHQLADNVKTQFCSWLQDLEDGEFKEAETLIREESAKRRSVPISARKQKMLDALSTTPVRLVAKEFGVTRQRCYQVCQEFGMKPIRQRQ